IVRFFTVTSSVPYTVSTKDIIISGGQKIVRAFIDYGSTTARPTQRDGITHGPSGIDSTNAFAGNAAQLVVLQPAVKIFKTCDSATNINGQIVVRFSGSVSNSGDETLTGISVTNNQPVAGTLVTNYGSLNLAPGATFPFSGVYTNISAS